MKDDTRDSDPYTFLDVVSDSDRKFSRRCSRKQKHKGMPIDYLARLSVQTSGPPKRLKSPASLQLELRYVEPSDLFRLDRSISVAM